MFDEAMQSVGLKNNFGLWMRLCNSGICFNQKGYQGYRQDVEVTLKDSQG